MMVKQMCEKNLVSELAWCEYEYDGKLARPHPSVCPV